MSAISSSIDPKKPVEPQSTLTETGAKILDAHFKFFRKKELKAFKKADLKDLPSLEIARRKFEMIEAGLADVVTISDGRSSRIRAKLPSKLRENATLAEVISDFAGDQSDDGKEFLARVRDHVGAGPAYELGRVKVKSNFSSNELTLLEKRLFSERRLDGKDMKIHVPPEGRGSIHIDFTYLGGGTGVEYRKLFLAGVIAHEASHKFANTADFAYAQDDWYARLSVAQSLNNADSYSFAAMSFYKGVVFAKAQDLVWHRRMGSRRTEEVGPSLEIRSSNTSLSTITVRSGHVQGQTEGRRDRRRRHDRWRWKIVPEQPSGRYEVDEIRADPFPSGHTSWQWGRLIRHPDGRVEDEPWPCEEVPGPAT